MVRYADLYDASDCLKHHLLHSMVNKKILGKMKDECTGLPIAELVGLRFKNVVNHDRRIKVISAGPKASETTSQNIRSKEALSEQKTFRHGKKMLLSEGHTIYGIHINKVSESPLDTRRWIADDGVHTLPY